MGTNILIQESYILFVDQYMNEYTFYDIQSFIILN